MADQDSFSAKDFHGRRLLVTFVCVLLSIHFLSSSSWSQSRITGSIDDTRLVTLHGNTHPLAQATFDRGAVSADFLADRMILILKRSATQENSLQQFLDQVQNPASPAYHQYLTPEQFGQQYGVSASDLKAITGWLRSAGFTVSHIHSGRMAIEFSGTVGQVQSAFHTAIHSYVVNGEQHYANASDPQIPEALASVVAGITLNNFAPRPLSQRKGQARLDPVTLHATPLFNDPGTHSSDCLNDYCFAVVPGDFATIYDTKPLLTSGIDGTGTTIGIVGDSNIDLSMVQRFRQIFLPAYSATNLPNIIIDGPDPGTELMQDEVEAYVDVETAGGVAPNAAINLYIAADGYVSNGIELAAARAVDDNQADVLSVSFGQCEAYLGTAGNQFYNNIFEQAASQGITALVASGDTGSADCDPPYNTSGRTEAASGLFVSGIASTPYDIAVGGTDFYYPANATLTTLSTYWNTPTASDPHNNADWSSAKSYIPEKPLNISDPALNQVSLGANMNAGGGGESSCTVYGGTNNSGDGPTLADCQGGYAKPSWQSGFGSDKARNLPDVSLFASDGSNYSFTAICAYAINDDCTLPTGGPNSITSPVMVSEVGGTSVSAPAMAGMMALVVEKAQSRQGQANTVLYPLSQQAPQVFHDITAGTNRVSCVAWTPDCGKDGFLTGYSAAVGYDMATGLGSVDGAALVDNWSKITFKPTTTTLSINPTTATHSTALIFTVKVTGGPASGEITLLTTHSSSSSQGQYTTNCAAFPCTFTYASLPGGSYNVYARYAGSSVYASSTSAAVPVTITPESSKVAIYDQYGTSASGYVTSLNGQTDLVFGGFLYFSSVPVPANYALPASESSITSTPATGTITVTDFGVSVGSPLVLDATGQALFQGINLPAGKHSLVASYSGDASYNPSNTISPLATPLNFTIIQTNTGGFFLEPGEQNVLPGSGATITADMYSGNRYQSVPAPTGTVTLTVTSATGAITVLPAANLVNNTTGRESTAAVNIPATALASGSNTATATYSGDNNYLSANSGKSAVLNVTTAQAKTNTLISINPTWPYAGQPLKINAQVHSEIGTSEGYPAGSVTFLDGNSILGTVATANLSDGENDSAASYTTSSLSAGKHTLTVNYSGDAQNLPSTDWIPVTVAQIVSSPLDFTLSATPVTVASGAANPSVNSTLTFVLNQTLSSASTINLSCVAATQAIRISCTTPASVSIAAGATTANSTAIISIAGLTARLDPMSNRSGDWLMAAGGFALALLLPIGFGRGRGLRAFFSMLLLLALVFGLSSCNDFNFSSHSVPAGKYSVTVTATLGSDSHQATIPVTVQ